MEIESAYLAVITVEQTPEVPLTLGRLVDAVMGEYNETCDLKEKVNMLTCMAVSVLTHPVVWQL